MENWGLITYRETSILYDANETSAAAREWVAVVIAHELAHQVTEKSFLILQYSVKHSIYFLVVRKPCDNEMVE